MSYPVSGMVREFMPKGYLGTGRPIIPHGMSVSLNASAVFKFTASSNPGRHLEAARFLGEEVSEADKNSAGEILGDAVTNIMRKIGMPNGLRAVGYSEKDADKLVEATLPQHRVTKLSPIAFTRSDLKNMFLDSMDLWWITGYFLIILTYKFRSFWYLKMDKKLLTPGPVTTSISTKNAMLNDWGSRDKKFIDLNSSIRESLVRMIDGENLYECIPMQGSGTFAVESMIGSLISKWSKILILINGAYGHRVKTICSYLNIDSIGYEVAENQIHDLQKVEKIIDENKDLTHVFIVYYETTSGILNPIKNIA